ncbi:MAG: tetratricopeptide repeat protein [Planctomycetota bacterium]
MRRNHSSAGTSGFPVRRTLVLLALGAFLATGGAPLAWAQDGPAVSGGGLEAARRAYPQKREEARTGVARAWRSVGDWCRGRDLHGSAAKYYRRALRWNADDEGARRRLGYKKTESGWTYRDDADRSPRDSGDAENRRALPGRVEKTQDRCARAFAQLATWCRDQGLEKEAKAAWLDVIALNGNHSTARRALGHKKKGGRWISPEGIAHRKWVAARRRRSAEVMDDSYDIWAYDYTTWRDEALGARLWKAGTKTWRVESNYPENTTKGLAAFCDAVHHWFSDLMGLPEPRRGSKPIRTFCILKSKKDYVRVLESANLSKERLAYAKGLGGFGLKGKIKLVRRTDIESVKDSLSHNIAEYILARSFPKASELPWVEEGIAYTVTGTLLGTTDTYCVQRSETVGARRSFRDFDTWEADILDMVIQGEDEPLELLAHLETNSLTSATAAKSWSVLNWLLETDRDLTLDWFQAIEDGMEQQRAAKEVFGADFRELDRRWRDWVKIVY